MNVRNGWKSEVEPATISLWESAASFDLFPPALRRGGGGQSVPNNAVRDKGVSSWTGWGRWLSYAVAALLIVYSISLVVLNEPAAGWNIFLALLLFAAVASGHKRAPGVAVVLTVLMALRFGVTLMSGTMTLDIVITGTLFVLSAAAAYHLRRQAMSA